MLQLHMASVLISVTLALVPVLGKKLLPWDAGQARHLGYHSLPSQVPAGTHLSTSP